MATRGIVAVVEGLLSQPAEWRGRYSHWDNNPERMRQVLGALVARDGVDKVIETLITNNASWSVIDPTTTLADEQETKSTIDPMSVIEGYGVIHTDVDKDDPSTMFTHLDSDDYAWAEWLYLIYRHQLIVYRLEQGQKWNENCFSHHSWDSLASVVLS